jgi:hypothetical protein
VTWVSVKGPNFGLANVYIDGVIKTTNATAYASSVHFGVQRAYTGLGAGNHTITIRVLGKRGSTSGKNTFIAVDAFKVGATTFSTPAAVYAWQKINHASAVNGQYVQFDVVGSYATFDFHGTSVD